MISLRLIHKLNDMGSFISLFLDIVICQTVSYSWQAYIVQIAQAVEYTDHVYIVFQI